VYAWVFPTPRSLALRPSDPPAEFEVLTDEPLEFVIEFATGASLFDARNQLQRNPLAGLLNFYNTLWGLPAKGVLGRQMASVPGNRIRYSLPAAVWADFAKGDTIYYRAIAFRQSRQGQPAGKMFYSTADQEAGSAPYIHVFLPTISPFYNRGTRPSSRQKTPCLMVWGNKVIEGSRQHPPADAATRPAVVLRGVNFSGLQYREPTWGTPEGRGSTHWWEAAGITRARIQEIASWGSNIIRLPINQDWVLNRKGSNNGVRYLEDIDQVIDWAAAAGMYVLLDLQVLDMRTQGRPPDWTQPMPDNLSLLFWRILANRYRSDPAVLYDLCNEPHKPGPSDWATYRGHQPPKDSGWIELWHEWVRQLEGVIHDAHGDALVFVSGIGGPCYAASLRSMPVRVPPFDPKNPRYIPNAVYSCHIYYRTQDDGDGVDESRGGKMGTVSPEHWTYWFGFDWLRQSFPIFIGEFGGQPKDFDPRSTSSNPKPHAVAAMIQWGQSLVDYLSALRKKQNGQWAGLAGWTAWSWGDEPHLVQRATGASRMGVTGGDRPYQMDPTNPAAHALTPFGTLVKGEVKKP
jgi:aryl-phospho-beta-D-glucosidase BglC (GH1 family)